MEISLEDRINTWHVSRQAQSPFFNNLPAELRLYIYRHALSSFSITAASSTGAHSRKTHDFCLRFDHQGDPDDDLLGELGDDHQECLDNIVPELVHASPGNLRSNWRPDFDEAQGMSLNILLACRRVLVEARPIMFEAERNYTFNNDPRSTISDCLRDADHKESLDQTPELQWEKRFRRVRLFAPVSTYHAILSRHANLWVHVQHLRITVRRTDWRLGVVASQPEAAGIPPAACFGWGQGPLQINPLGPPVSPEMSQFRDKRRANLNIAHMGAMMKATRDFGRGAQDSEKPALAPFLQQGSVDIPSWVPPQVRYTAGMWARELVNMPHIKTLTMDFDTTQEKRGQLAAIVEWAVRTWRFPLNPAHGGSHYLAADEASVRRMAWRGTAGDWDWLGPCAGCSPQADGAASLESSSQIPALCPIPTHANIMSKFRRGLGPRMYSWSVTWTPRKYEGPEQFPYQDSECLQVLPGDLQ